MRSLMAKEVSEKYKRTQAAEEKVKDIEISEVDKNFILKELKFVKINIWIDDKIVQFY